MAHPTIAQLRHLVRILAYDVSTHAADELEDDNLSILDLENIILTGEIIERQRDQVTREVKYVIQGATLAGDAAETVVKARQSGRLYVITAYLA